MKKIILITAICAALVACNKESEPNSFKKGQRVTLAVSAEVPAATKVTSELDADGATINFHWQAGDKIKVTIGDESSVFTLQSGSGSASASFEGLMPASGSKFNIQYPCDTPDITSQSYSSSEAIPHDAMLFTAIDCTLESGSLMLIPRNAVLRLNLYGEGKTVGKIEVAGESATSILNVDPAVALPEESAKSTPFFIVVPAGEYKFSAEVFDDATPPASICKFETSAKQTLTDGRILNMTESKKVMIYVTSVALDKTEVQLQEGESVTLTATVKPDDAPDKTVVWSTSDAAVATVDNGTVTAKKPGTATITATSGGVAASCAVTVTNFSSIQKMDFGTSMDGDADTYDYANLSSGGTANCYIVSAAGAYKFKATVKGNSTESVGTPATAEVLWESFGTDVAPSVGDIIASASLADGYVTFSTPETLANGNAVIAVKDAGGTILWSWHIWVCNGFDPVATQQVYANNAGTMMDRDLGARSSTPGTVDALGLFYQWGRKDPFMGNRSTTDNSPAEASISWPSAVNTDSTCGTIQYACQNPTVFIMNRCGHWIYTSDMELWSNSKTIFDPCPTGWKVPKGGADGVWAKAFKNYNASDQFAASEFWQSSNYGMLFSAAICGKQAWYPACGYIDSGLGNMNRYYNSCYGYRWSTTARGSEVYVFSILHSSFYTTPIVRTYEESFSPATGTTVRCCKE